MAGGRETGPRLPGESTIAGCATLTNDAMVPVAVSFSDGGDGTCEFQNKRGLWKAEIPATVMIRRSDDPLVFHCKTPDGREATQRVSLSRYTRKDSLRRLILQLTRRLQTLCRSQLKPTC
jgi:hypothetical protein